MQVACDTIEAQLWLSLAQDYRTEIEKEVANTPEDKFIRDSALQRVDKFIGKLAKAANGGREGVKL